ncbi:hypothetical protein Ahy_Scaffold1g106954 isoform I [Arachis hypogaea]|uniref:Uncharacterized protein n=1 Tax=Arachis hypogaea TaxID=3818 RepID=A0A444WTS4_ARAHY|nr:hypothetical protein Ahy_Scaffold1g106954 isoform I [Arachis hypogaea]
MANSSLSGSVPALWLSFHHKRQRKNASPKTTSFLQTVLTFSPESTSATTTPPWRLPLTETTGATSAASQRSKFCRRTVSPRSWKSEETRS